MALTPKQAYVLANQYTNESIEGTSGALAGKNCQIAGIEDIVKDGIKGTRVTFTWYKDGEKVARTEYLDVFDGEQGEKGDPGEQGEEGFSPEITVAEATESIYRLKIVTKNGELYTPNLKGSGGGIDVDVKDDSLVFTY